jgi:hypothetical protein
MLFIPYIFLLIWFYPTNAPEDESHINFETCWTIFKEIYVLNNRK